MRLRRPLNSLEEAERGVLSWGVHATVVRPQALQERIRMVGEAFTQRYAPEAEG
jgi:predicted DNA-binding transcriptional regulator YafY